MLTTTYPIHPLTITFGQLRSILPRTVGLCLPAADELEQREQGVLFAHELSNLTVTVFCDGFFLWRDSARSASYAVDRCSHRGTVSRLESGERTRKLSESPEKEKENRHFITEHGLRGGAVAR